ncbi:AAA family ATPase, partial [Acinetobacter baumannii]
MVILAFYNLKGGVGKTAASVNFAYLAAKEGYKTLLWDLDPQGSSSFYFGATAQT